MRLNLNASKTELIWFNRLLTPATDIPHTVINLGPDCSIKSADVVRDLGVLLDNTLPLKFQIASITKSCFFYLRRIRQVKKSLNENCLRALVQGWSSLDFIIATLSSMASPHPGAGRLGAAVWAPSFGSGGVWAPDVWAPDVWAPAFMRGEIRFS